MSTATAVTTSRQPSSRKRLEYPPGVQRNRFIWEYVFAFTVYHALALLAFVPWFFSWTGLTLCVLGFYLFGTLGINLCYHRLLTHRSFACPKWLEHFFSIIGVCCLQDTPARWVAVHRLHHQNSDEQRDPHSPLVSFFWGHMDWLLRKNSELERMSLYEHYAKDILKDRFYFKLERNLAWVWINLAQWLFFYLVGFVIGYAASGWNLMAGVQFGASLWLWGCIIRTVFVWHITWSVNSVTHLWGYQNYNTGENSRNNVFVGLWSNGEGWHNNHHAQPRCAAHGHKWYEVDVTWITIWLLSKVGLAWKIVPVKPQKKDEVVPITEEDIQPPA